MKRTTSVASKVLAAVIGLQSLLLTFSPQAAAAAYSTTNLADHLVISQVRHNGIESNDFIEIHNPTNQIVDFAAGYSLTFCKAEGGFELLTLSINPSNPSASTVIQPGGYLLIASTYGAENGVYNFFNEADLKYHHGNFNLLPADECVILSKSGSQVDVVSWGDPDNISEGYLDNNLASDRSFLRAPGNGEGNGIDTNTANDFTTITPTRSDVRNTSSRAELAGSPVISTVTPADLSTVLVENVTVSATVTDAGSGFNADLAQAFSLTIDSNTVAPTSLVTDIVTFAATNLADGIHTAVLTATDRVGFSTTKTWTFTVNVAPTVTITTTNVVTTATKATATVQLTYPADVTMMRIAFDGTLDTENWELVASTVTRDLPTVGGNRMIAVQVKDAVGNISAVATTSAQVTAPTIGAPEYALSSTTGNTIAITWAKVADAAGYIVRYNDGQVMYGPISTNNTFLTITGLDLSKTYQFEVAAFNIYGSVSSFTKVYPPELSPAKDKFAPTATTTTVVSTNTTAVAVTPAIAETTTVTERTAPVATEETVEPSPTPTVSPSPTPAASPEGEVRSDSDDRSPDWTRVIVALSILIIAAGVATGGWYLYQWWIGQDKDNKKDKSKGRW